MTGSTPPSPFTAEVVVGCVVPAKLAVPVRPTPVDTPAPTVPVVAWASCVNWLWRPPPSCWLVVGAVVSFGRPVRPKAVVPGCSEVVGPGRPIEVAVPERLVCVVVAGLDRPVSEVLVVPVRLVCSGSEVVAPVCCKVTGPGRPVCCEVEIPVFSEVAGPGRPESIYM